MIDIILAEEYRKNLEDGLFSLFFEMRNGGNVIWKSRQTFYYSMHAA